VSSRIYWELEKEVHSVRMKKNNIAREYLRKNRNGKKRKETTYFVDNNTNPKTAVLHG